MWLRIAHRGAAGTRPELTEVAFERALEIGVDMIELDVQLTRDRQLVVLHDTELGRTVAGSGPVRDHTLEELRGLDAGSWFDAAYADQGVLSLAEVLEQTAGRTQLNVEIKSPRQDWRDTAVELAQLLDERQCNQAVLVSSFSMGALAAVREVSPTARIAVLWHEPNLVDAYRNAEQLAAEAIHPHYHLVTERLIAAAAKRGLEVNTWTVNKVSTMRKLIDLGVDGLISDYPEIYAELRSARL